MTAVQHILADSLRASGDVTKFVSTALDHLSVFDKIFQLYSDKTADMDDEETYELARVIIAIGDLFPAVMLLHMCQMAKTADLVGLFGRYSALNGLIDAKRLRMAYKLKPMLDGKAIMQLYEIKGGKMLKLLLDEVVRF